uniref:Uncharacterized protein n=1 Tax=Arundo donax TaxID=35708 RepID=A0A0A9DH70_ARUDO
MHWARWVRYGSACELLLSVGTRLWSSELNAASNFKIDSDITTLSDASFSCWSLSCDLFILDLDFPDFDAFSGLATSMDGMRSWMEVAYWRHKAFSFSTFCVCK